MPKRPDTVRRRGRPHGLVIQGRKRTRRKRRPDTSADQVSFLDPDEMADVKRQRELDVSVHAEDTAEAVG